jgi:hypothetical protein
MSNTFTDHNVLSVFFCINRLLRRPYVTLVFSVPASSLFARQKEEYVLRLVFGCAQNSGCYKYVQVSILVAL